MCGRFTYRLTWREIYELYRLTMPELPGRNLQARYNICRTTTIDAVIERAAALLSFLHARQSRPACDHNPSTPISVSGLPRMSLPGRAPRPAGHQPWFK
jgi:putative SOS response-associated peptidase YedK